MNGGIIQNSLENIKRIPESVYIALLIIFVGLSSFALGRLSAFEVASQPIRVTAPDLVDGEALVIGGQVIGSRSGNKYHFPWCSGVERIALHNRVWFKDENEARQRGYSPAGNCQGL